MITNEEFLNKQNFLNNSNIQKLLVDNIFNLAILGNTKINSLFNDILLDEKEKNIWKFVEQNAYSFTISNLESEFSTQYIGNSRNYVFNKKQDSNFQIAFVESADLKIRRVIERWISLTLPDNDYSFYYDDICSNVIFKPVNTSFQTNKNSRIIYEKCVPVNYQDITYDLGKDADLKIISVEFIYKRNVMG